jgi:hypothetical protein
MADLLPQTLQNLLVQMVINCFAWRNKFLINNALKVNVLLMYDLTCLPFFRHGHDELPLKGLLFGFCAIPINPGSNPCYDPQEEVLVVSDFSQQVLAHKHMLWLLLVHEQLKHKLCTDHIQALPLNLVPRSIQGVYAASDLSNGTSSVCIDLNVLNFQLKFLYASIKKTTQKSVLPMALSQKTVLSTSYISSTVFLRLK